MSATTAFFGGLPRAAQRPGLTLALAAATALATVLVMLPFASRLGRELNAGAGAAAFLKEGDLLACSLAVRESRAGGLVGALLLVAIPLFLFARLFLAGSVMGKLNPRDGYGAGQSFFALGARHFWPFALHALLNLFSTGALLGAAMAVTGVFSILTENAASARAPLAVAGVRLLFAWGALALGARALDFGRAHMLQRGGFRPVDGWLTGLKAVVTRPITALGLSLWTSLARLTVFLLWSGLDWKLHIHGWFSLLLALALLGAYLLLASFLRVVAMAAGYIVMERA